MQTVSKIA